MTRRCLVVGGSGGLGRVIAYQLAARGDSVGLLARDGVKLAEAAAAIEQKGGRARSFSADLLDAEGLKASVRDFVQWAGGLDSLVVASGRLKAVGPLLDVDPSQWRGDLETDVLGPVAAIRASLPLLKESAHPSICVLVGPGHQQALAHASAYVSAQAALVRLVEALDIELAPMRIPIYAVFPGLTPAGFTQSILESEAGRRWLPRFTEAFAEGKEVEPDVVAEMVAWLSDLRPKQLSGRVVFAPITPDLLELRLDRIANEDRHRLRLT